MLKSLIIPIILQLCGMLVVIIEIILPSAGLLALLAVSLIGYSLYLVFTEISTNVGFIFVAADVFILPVLLLTGIKLLAKSPVTLKTELSSRDGITSQNSEDASFIGLTGSAITDLRPAGSAIINNKRVDVVSRGEYIEKGTHITVVSVTGNQIIVTATDDK